MLIHLQVWVKLSTKEKHTQPIPTPPEDVKFVAILVQVITLLHSLYLFAVFLFILRYFKSITNPTMKWFNFTLLTKCKRRVKFNFFINM